MPADEWSGQPDSGEVGDEHVVDVTDLRPRPRSHLRPAQMATEDGRRPRTGTRRQSRHRLALSLSLLLLLAVLLSLVGQRAGVPFLDGATPGPAAHTSGSPTSAGAVVVVSIVPSQPTPTIDLATPTLLPGGVAQPPLGAAPTRCDGLASALTPAGPPAAGEAIGFPPVRVGGFTGTRPYATLPLGPSALSYGWNAPYTRYGWPAGMLLVVRSDLTGPVTLVGWNPLDGHPLWFGLVEAGVWGAPTQILPSYTLDPTHPSVPAGGSDSTGTFWYGYIFLPAAGCYSLVATWPGGDWAFVVSAGR